MFDAHFRDENIEAQKPAKVAQLDLNMSISNDWVPLGCSGDRMNKQHTDRSTQLVCPC